MLSTRDVPLLRYARKVAFSSLLTRGQWARQVTSNPVFSHDGSIVEIAAVGIMSGLATNRSEHPSKEVPEEDSFETRYFITASGMDGGARRSGTDFHSPVRTVPRANFRRTGKLDANRRAEYRGQLHGRVSWRPFIP